MNKLETTCKVIQATVDDYTKRINDLIAERTKYMDDHMADCAEFHVGDIVFDENGICLGEVFELFRHQHSQGHPFHDNYMGVDYRYGTTGTTGRTRTTVADPTRLMSIEGAKQRLSALLEIMEKVAK